MFQKLTVLVLVLGFILLGPAGEGVGASSKGSPESASLLTTTTQQTNSSYPVVDTGQEPCYDDRGKITCPTAGEAFYGQDAQYDGHQPNYTLSADGLTVYDNITGLTWTQSPDLNVDGDIDVDDKLTFAQAQTYADTLNAQNYGGYSDWRLPTMKQLYSLMDFRGTDPVPTSTDPSQLTPFIDTDYFDFGYGDIANGERIIDAQFWSSNTYAGTVFGNQQATFGLNLADGRIKGYPSGTIGPITKLNYVYFVRGNTDYGVNDFTDNGDGTITDNATGLMWSQGDSGQGMNWEDALAWVQARNDENYLGHDDWRLPNAKELQSLVDYGRSPDTTDSATIDPIFSATEITNEAGELDYPFYWSSTSHLRFDDTASAAVYVAFGRGLGSMDSVNVIDVHGAGCQRSDPKDGDPDDYPRWGFGPQGDVQRVFNYVRLVRDTDTEGTPPGNYAIHLPLILKGGAAACASSSPATNDTVAVTDACSGAGEGDACEFTTSFGTIIGTCLLVEGQFTCVPDQDRPEQDRPREVEPSTSHGQPPPGGDPEQGQPAGARRRGPDLVAAAAQLGISEETLRAALGEPGQRPPDLAAAAQQLGITEGDLITALGLPPNRQPPQNRP